MKRSGWLPTQASRCQLLYALTQANERSRSFVSVCSRLPPNPGRNDGKFKEA